MLSCGDSLSLSLENATSDVDLNYNTAPSVWYKIIGEGHYYTLSRAFTSGTYNTVPTYLFELVDGELEILNYYIYDNLFLEAGEDYYIEGMTYYVAFYDNTNISVSCVDKLENDLIENAYPITCGATYFGYDFSATTDFSDNKPDIWFKIAGNNEYLQYYDNWTGANYSIIYTLEGGAISEFGDFIDNKIFLPIGQDYYVRAKLGSLDYSDSKEYQFDVDFTCLPVADNDEWKGKSFKS